MKTICPLLKKECIEHQCAWYMHIIGTDPQTGAQKDEWSCAVQLLPYMMVEVASKTRGVQASVESMRNEVVQRQDALNGAVASAQRGHLGVSHETAHIIGNDPPARLRRAAVDEHGAGVEDRSESNRTD